MIAQPSDSTPLLQTIVMKVQALPSEQQQSVLDYVEFLAQKAQSQLPQPTLWDKIDEIMAEVPEEEWKKMPTDGSYQHDHYLYGTPKRD